MIMTLVAGEADSEEKLSNVLGQHLRIAADPEITARRMLEGGAAGRHDLVYELVVWPILRDLILNPSSELPNTALAQVFAVDLEHIRPFIGPIVDVIGAVQELVDEP